MNDDEIFDYVQQLTTDSAEDAYFALLTHSTEVNIPAFIRAYHEQNNPHVRASLLEIVWRQHPSSTPLEFLAQALRDSSAEVWKSALDGLVSIARPECVVILECERQHLLEADPENASTRPDWIAEAIQQLSNQNT